MHLQRARQKLKTLTEAELEHCIQLAQAEIDNYAQSIENYPPERLRKYGTPWMANLVNRKLVFQKELHDRISRPSHERQEESHSGQIQTFSF